MSLSDKAKPAIPTFGLPEALLVAFVTIAGYAACWGYNVGYCQAFSLPYYLVRVSLEETLVSCLAVFAFFFFIALFSQNLVRVFFLSEKVRLACSRKAAIMSATIFFMALGILVPSLSGFSEALNVLKYVALLFFGLCLLPPLFYFGLRRVNVTSRQAARGTHRAFRLNLRRSLQFSQKKPIPVLLLLSAIIIGSYLHGFSIARNTKDFTIIEAEKLVVIARYADYFLCKPYTDDHMQVLTGQFRIYSLEDMEARVMKRVILDRPPRIVSSSP